MGKVKKVHQETVEDQSDDGWADSDNDETLLKEILTFGGNKDDLDLIKANALPDPNLDEEALINELKAFMAKDLKLNPKKSKVIIVDDAPTTEKPDTEEAKLLKKELSNIINGKSDAPSTNEPTSKHADDPHLKSRKSAILSNDINSSKLMIEPISMWHRIQLEPIAAPNSSTTIQESDLVKLYQKSIELYNAEVEKFEKSRSMSADKEFISTVLRSGTVTDKVSAITLLVQESPLHNLKHLQTSLFNNMAKKKSRREAMLAMDSIKDLLINNLLPDRKLRYFRDQPITSPNVTPKHLIAWYYEDCLKKFYFEFIQLVEDLSKDVLLHVKNKMILYVYELLNAKPEQEQNLLALLVNKLGDLDRKISSKAVHLLLQLLQHHPNMKIFVIKESQHLIFRANILEKAQYCAITFLNQIVLSNRESDVLAANALVDVYFRVFELLVRKVKGDPIEVEKKDKGRWKNGGKGKNLGKNKPQEKKVGLSMKVDGVDAKMMAALLTGVNRSFPYAKIDDEVLTNHINTLFTITHLGSFNTCIQSLTLLYQIQLDRTSLTMRFYRVLYETLFDPRLLTASKQAMFLNLLYRSLKSDSSVSRNRAFVKRIVQVCSFVGTPFVCASLFLIGRIAEEKPGIWSLVDMPEDDGEEERFKDILEDEEKDEKLDEEEKNEKPDEKKIENSKRNVYDGLKREPLFSNADQSCLWELIPFTKHFHPTVCLYAQTLLSRLQITPPKDSTNYDPLQNHTLVRFLDRFVYKNPKKVLSAHSKGSSVMQPRGIVGMSEGMIVAGGNKKRNVLVVGEGGSKRMDDVPVNVNGWGKDGEDVPVDEKFYYQFFKEKQQSQKPVVEKQVEEQGSDSDSDDFVMEEVNDDGLDEDEVWKAIARSSGFPDELKEDQGDVDNTDEEDWNDEEEEVASDNEMAEWDTQEPVQDEGDSSEGDEELADIFMQEEDEYSDDEITKQEPENKVSAPGKGKRSTKAITRLSEKAASLGFKGDYFSRLLSSKNKKDGDDDEEGDVGIFASMDDFTDLIDMENDDAEEEEESISQGISEMRENGKRKGYQGKKSFKAFKKSRKMK